MRLDRESPPSGEVSATSLGAAALASLLLAGLLLPAMRAAPVIFIEDDGFFYAKIAYNIATGHGSTFDGLNVTSGYHLLWGFVLAACSKVLAIFTLDRSYHLAIYVALAIFLCLWIGLALFERPLERLAVLALGLWCFCMTEALLSSALLLYLFARFLRRPGDFARTTADLVVIALVPLARIDVTLVVGFLALAFLPREPRVCARIVGALAVGAAVHALLMLALFGHVFSVSSMLKAGASQSAGLLARIHINVFDSRAQAVKAFSVAALAILAAVAALRSREGVDRDYRRRWLFALSATSLYFLGLFLFTVMRNWYFTSTLLSLMFLVAEAPKRTDPAPPSPSPSGALSPLDVFSVAVTLMITGICIRSATFNQLDRGHSMAFVQAVNRVVPASEPIFQIDGTGFTGYWVDAPVIDGDGLVNSYEYLELLRGDRLGDYLERRDICFIIRDTPLADAHVVDYHGMKVDAPEVATLLSPPPGGNSLWQWRLFGLEAPRCARRVPR